MHTLYIHIDEKLDAANMLSLKNELSNIRYINDVEISARSPHDMLVEFEEAHISPMFILKQLGRHGLHADIMSA